MTDCVALAAVRSAVALPNRNPNSNPRALPAVAASSSSGQSGSRKTFLSAQRQSLGGAVLQTNVKPNQSCSSREEQCRPGRKRFGAVLPVVARSGGNRPPPGASRPRPRLQQRTQGPDGKGEDTPLMNAGIRAPQVRLIAEDQSMVGVVSREEALARAQQATLDLVLIAADADPPVARIMDYGKFRYEQQKKKRDQQRKVMANRQELKELKMRYNIDIGDYNVRLKQAIKFLKEGDKVKVSAQFRGREMEFKELGMQLFKRFAADVAEVGVVETRAQMEGKTMAMVLIPNKVAIAKAAAAERKQQKAREKAVAEPSSPSDEDEGDEDLRVMGGLTDIEDSDGEDDADLARGAESGVESGGEEELGSFVSSSSSSSGKDAAAAPLPQAAAS